MSKDLRDDWGIADLSEYGHTELDGLKTIKKSDRIKNDFAKYGFEMPEFECEILKEINHHQIIGTFKFEGVDYASTWNKKTGFCNQDKSFNLTLIKKEWYKNKDNFPCLVYGRWEQFIPDEDNESYRRYFVYIDDINELINYFDDLEKNKSMFRLATNKEIESLKIKDKDD